MTRGIGDQRFRIQILQVHIHSTDLMILIGGVVINSLLGAAAGGIEGDLICSVYIAAAAGLIHKAENVKKLADAFRFRASGNGVGTGKCSPGEP